MQRFIFIFIIILINFCPVTLLAINSNLVCNHGVGQIRPNVSENGVVKGRILDRITKKPVEGAYVYVTKKRTIWNITDSSGFFSLVINDKNLVDSGDAETGLEHIVISISCLGYKPINVSLIQNSTYYLDQQSLFIREVVVTATESHGMTSSSKIGKHAMEHLQPSSFADILELIPGGKANDPVFSTPNTIHLREVPILSSDYATSSLGTSFIIDGAPISTNANMQSMNGAWEYGVKKRDFTNMGVDMRTISTDDIGNVEIIRGIPSVEYGDLTSGLVKIERKRGGNKFCARFKADMKSKLYYIGKGYEWEKRYLSINISADYLDSKSDPRNTMENYKRFTGSARINKSWKLPEYNISLSTNADYSGSFDREKIDPDLNSGAIDKYKSEYNRFALSSTIDIKAIGKKIFKDFLFTSSFSTQHDRLSHTKLIQLQRDTPAAVTTVEGESDAVILPYTYIASQTVDGKPFNAFIKANAVFSIPFEKLENSLKIGGDWNMDKNYGDGQVFNPSRPLYPGISTRMRKYSTIPSLHNLSFYAEESLRIPVGRQAIYIVAGLRGITMLNLGNRFDMSGKFYYDPRINAKWILPAFSIGKKDIWVEFSGGIGRHTKMPTAPQLYPDAVYMDLVQLNYYHPNADYKRINLMTYIVDPTNRALNPAQNQKWELRADISVNGNRLSLTYFEENMKSGFRRSVVYNPYTYKKYDASIIDASTLTEPPATDNLPYTIQNELKAYTSITNGSRTYKRGIEYTFSTKRIQSLRTRLTISGAWFYTMYRNSQPVAKRPTVVVDNQQYKYVGIYLDDDGYIREMANTNFTIDTDIPSIKIGISFSAQCVWFTSSKNMSKSRNPIQYMDEKGNIYDFTEINAQDNYMKWLINSYSESTFARHTIPIGMNMNLKVTKKILQDRLMIALFVNKIMDYYPNYRSNGLIIRRHVTPYFGLEININI